ncbi:PQQ-dependent dehydrogenase, methanol/ethanol family [Blastomonas sp. UPD001]|jgi:quinohemoprotein ethanol dehydrogenase|uniref:PQQ-dependent dehydrogenase, methanol/ethanol family n=1 Tax=Blastomonas sp. UPD001 TaxID=2217673 RepID=UPI000E347A7D|nr:PQQ-dependent dehydrogenase, methanol/ethanol family [Blastomonas sp. UPD001]MBL0966554.1 PQQ-dependent dehydrogenase, methanol/ethanol family [Blastomonas sp.]
MRLKAAFGAALALLVASCSGGGADTQATDTTGIDGARIIKADGSEWLSYGRTYDEQRFSPLDQINTGNVGELGLAWYADLDTARGQEATPLVIDGKIYVTTAWSKVKAFDATTGKPLWDYDPKVPGETGVKACCDVVNRGLAAWGNMLFLGTLDGRLIALDRGTGREIWSKVTVDQAKAYTITGAPRVIDGMVIIGNGGAEFGVRGFVAAYDAATGKQLWKFYTVPDRPGANEAEYLKAAETSWKGEYWNIGGGGTVWDAMAYDPELGLLYVGVGNGSPWNQAYRSPGGGDNLYLSSIVAIRVKTGEYAWHYQTTPGETWDYTATQHIMLADLEIGGKTRKVLMQAPKNGFFYVIDRATGEFISANNFVPVNWATGIDQQTGRPIENPAARVDKTGKPFIVSPGPLGAHNWHPMAYDAKQKLVFIPAQITAYPYIPAAGWKPSKIGFNVGMDTANNAMPADNAVREAAKKATKGVLIAWDPVAQKERWRVTLGGPWNGGVLATAGGLVFQGNAMGNFVAYDSASGKNLWSFEAQTGVVAAPMTYSIDGEQYVAVLAGWGGAWPITAGVLSDMSGPVRNISRLLVFKLGGKAKLPAMPAADALPLDPPGLTAAADVVQGGAQLYGRYCTVCHGDAAVQASARGGIIPDLRYSGTLASAENWQMIVHGGALKDNGMVSFAPVMSKPEIDSIRQYVIARANEDKALMTKKVAMK